MATELLTDKGKPDAEGGVRLSQMGYVRSYSVELDFPVEQVALELKGEPARGVPPIIDLSVMEKNKETGEFGIPKFPFPRSYVGATSYTMFRKDFDKPLPPGTYAFNFAYHNDEEFPDEDRAVSMRKIEFHDARSADFHTSATP